MPRPAPQSNRPVMANATLKVALGILALLALVQFAASVMLPGELPEQSDRHAEGAPGEGAERDFQSAWGLPAMPEAGAAATDAARADLTAGRGTQGAIDLALPLVRTTPREEKKPLELERGAAALGDPELRRVVSSAIQQRRAGDMRTAVAQLHEAIGMAPEHPRVLFELAVTYEEMLMTDKAADRYQQVARLGEEGAGDLYEIAYRKITEGLHNFPTTSPTEEALYISDVQEHRRGNMSEGQEVMLFVTLMAKPEVKIKLSDVAVQVNFYDLKNRSEVVPTRSDPATTEWTTAPVAWQDGEPETVAVRYFMPPMGPGEIAANGELTYYGYVIDVYYEGRLVDSVARPRRLARMPLESEILNGSPLFDDGGDFDPGVNGLLPTDLYFEGP